jgi:predicted phosphodiesterase
MNVFGAQRVSRRDVLTAGAASFGALGLTRLALGDPGTASDSISFFVVGDTHYLASKEETSQLDEASREVTSRLVEWLNKLLGSELPATVGGGNVAAPRGVIHLGDVIDTGDKQGRVQSAMQETEWRAFADDFGLNGADGRLKLPVYELHGNHDSPSGQGLAIDAIKERNRQRPGLVNVSENGLHYSWNWGDVHFVNLGIVVGPVKEVARKRRYAPLDSLPFLIDDLSQHARDGRPVVVSHHVDVTRYSGPCDRHADATSGEWDPCDVAGYYELLTKHNVVAILYGHTHARHVFRWNGTKETKNSTGIPTFNNDNSSHFHSATQAFLHFEITSRELVAREFATKDSWRTGEWTQVWKFPRAAT